MAFAASVTTAKAVSSIVVGSSEQLKYMTKVVPAGVWFRESDTGKMKVSDGVNKYETLSYTIDAVFTDAHKALMDNAGAANGVATLDSTGKLSMDALPTELTSSVLSGAVKYVADISARDALAADQKGGLIVVIDASADSSVATGTAGYSWDGSAWTKIFESESMDVSLADYFAMSTNTLDDVKDGTTYVRMSAEWKASVDNDLNDLKTRMGKAETDIVANTNAAAAAQSTADSAVAAAGVADGKAVAAQGTADEALTKAGENATAIASLTTTVSDNKTAADTGIQQAKDAAAEADRKAVAAQGAADAAQGAADAAQAAADAAQGDIDTHKQTYTADKAALDQLVGEHTTKISALETLTAGHVTDIAALQSAVDTLSGTDISGIKSRLDTAEGEIDTLQTWQAEAQADIEDHETRVAALEDHALLDTDTLFFNAPTVAELENYIVD